MAFGFRDLRARTPLSLGLSCFPNVHTYVHGHLSRRGPWHLHGVCRYPLNQAFGHEHGRWVISISKSRPHLFLIDRSIGQTFGPEALCGRRLVVH